MVRSVRRHILSALCGGLVAGLACTAFGQRQPPTSAASPVRPEQAIMQALAANVVTAPFPIRVTPRNGRYVLEGRVGNKEAHDTAVRICIALGYPITDNLVIDTRQNLAAAAWTAGTLGPMAGAMGPLMVSPMGLNGYIYPPPLFGRYDDPFFGLQPPVISYPPWWRTIASRQPLDPSLTGPYPVPPVGSMPPGTVQPGGGQAAASTGAPAQLPADLAGSLTTPPPQDGNIELTINTRGVAVLRGTVPTLADRIAVGQRIAQTPGVTEVLNLLSVKDTSSAAPGDGAGPNPAERAPQQPPPPPQPEPAPQAAERAPEAPPQPAQRAPEAAPQLPARHANITVDSSPLSDRVAKALARRPAVAELPIRVSAHEGSITLSGRVPTVYEAMLAFRAAQQTPGVRSVEDRLEFIVPDVEKPNPLIQKGRPEDVEPYLEAQIRRQVGDLAHVDRVDVQGDSLEIHGVVTHADDLPRLQAVLRSMPLLRGYRLHPEFQPE